MTVADTKAFFHSVRVSKKSMDRLIERAKTYRSMAYKMTGSIETVPHAKGENTSRVENYATRLMDLSAACSARSAVFYSKIRQAESVIDSLPKERYREVMELRYLNCKKWEEVAEIMDYKDIRSVYKVHGNALIAASKLM